MKLYAKMKDSRVTALTTAEAWAAHPSNKALLAVAHYGILSTKTAIFIAGRLVWRSRRSRGL